MKITRAEKVWLGLVVLFYVLYNLPFVPPYGDAVGTIIHGIATIVPLWIIIYVGFFKINRMYRPKDSFEIEGEKQTEQQGGE